jgi:hypothetical protein
VDELLQIQIISEDDFVDIDLPMVSYQRAMDGVQEISARGRHRDGSVGFAVSLGPVWEHQDLENSELTLYWGRAEIVSVGTRERRVCTTPRRGVWNRIGPQENA